MAEAASTSSRSSSSNLAPAPRRPSLAPLSLDERYPTGYSLSIVATQTVPLPPLDPVTGFPLAASSHSHHPSGSVVMYGIAAMPPANPPSYSPYASPHSSIDDDDRDAGADAALSPIAESPSAGAAPSPSPSPSSAAAPEPLSYHWKRFSEFAALDSTLASLMTDTQRLLCGSLPPLPSKFASLLKKPDDPDLVRSRVEGLNLYLDALAPLTHSGVGAVSTAITNWLDHHRNLSPEECLVASARESAEQKAAAAAAHHTGVGAGV